VPPVRAKKLRYFEDANFKVRVLPPAAVESSGPAGQDAWYACVDAPMPDAEAARGGDDAAGLERKQIWEPEHEIDNQAPQPEPEPGADVEKDEAADPADDRNLKVVRRAAAADRGDPDFLPEF
jgi:type IV secretion system protein VirD4